MVATGIIILGNHGTLSSVEAVFSFHVPVITLQLYIYNCNYYCLSALCTLIHTMLLVVEKQTEIWFLHIVPNSKYCSTFIKNGIAGYEMFFAIGVSSVGVYTAQAWWWGYILSLVLHISKYLAMLSNWRCEVEDHGCYSLEREVFTATWGWARWAMQNQEDEI